MEFPAYYIYFFPERFRFQSTVYKGSAEICSESGPSRISVGDDGYWWANICSIFLLVWVCINYLSMLLNDITTNYLDRWTSFPSISLWAPMMAGVLMGFSISWIFVCQAFFLLLLAHTDILWYCSWVYSTILSMHIYLLQPRLSRRTLSVVVLLALYSRFVFGILSVTGSCSWG